jgi:transcriptional regulator with XRE-family HTH domain
LVGQYYLKQQVQQRMNCGSALKRFMAASRDCKTQLALAKKSGVGQSTIGRILRGEGATQRSTVSLLVEALGITSEEFWGAAEGDAPVRREPREDWVADGALHVQACQVARRRAGRGLKELWQEEDQALQVLEQCRQQEAQAVKQVDNLIFGQQLRWEMDPGGMEVEVSA